MDDTADFGFGSDNILKLEMGSNLPLMRLEIEMQGTGGRGGGGDVVVVIIVEKEEGEERN